MTSAIDICNEALATIGARSTINSLDEASKEAVNCKIFYTPLRKALLRAVHWGFARKQQLLTEIGNLVDETSPYPWAWKYAYPADCERFRYLVPMPVQTTATAEVIPEDAFQTWPLPMPCRDWQYIIGNDVTRKCVLTDVQYAIGVYTADIENPDLWESAFREALVAALAAKLAMPISGKIQLMNTFRDFANDAVIAARAADANEAQPSTEHTPDWIQARGAPWGYGLGLAYAGGAGLYYQGPDRWAM